MTDSDAHREQFFTLDRRGINLLRLKHVLSNDAGNDYYISLHSLERFALKYSEMIGSPEAGETV